MYPMRALTASGSRATSAPATTAVPSVGVSAPHSMRISVVLPAPSGPTSAKISLCATERSRWSTAISAPKRRVNPRQRTAVSSAAGEALTDATIRPPHPQSLSLQGGGNIAGRYRARSSWAGAGAGHHEGIRRQSWLQHAVLVAQLDFDGEDELDALFPGLHVSRGELGAIADLRDRAVKHTRSEERRVGKECRSRWSPYH